jgi:hypothetical protein
MVYRVHTAWKDGHIPGVLLIDIKPAYQKHSEKMTSQPNDGQSDGLRPYTMDGELSLRITGGDNH